MFFRFRLEFQKNDSGVLCISTQEKNLALLLNEHAMLALAALFATHRHNGCFAVGQFDRRAVCRCFGQEDFLSSVEQQCEAWSSEERSNMLQESELHPTPRIPENTIASLNISQVNRPQTMGKQGLQLDRQLRQVGHLGSSLFSSNRVLGATLSWQLLVHLVPCLPSDCFVIWSWDVYSGMP